LICKPWLGASARSQAVKSALRCKSGQSSAVLGVGSVDGAWLMDNPFYKAERFRFVSNPLPE
jgi:hypothetical protein